MAPYRNHLPQLSNALFLTDGGIETTLIFREELNLPDFAAFDLLKSETGYAAIVNYFRTYVTLAKAYQVGLILESVTWRANPDWVTKLGYSNDELVEINQKAIALLQNIRQAYETPQTPMVISGCIGPRGDAMTAQQAQAYHQAQINAFRDADADLVTAITMNYVEEAIGVTLAAQAADMPMVISFTVETDGRLPTGQTLKEAIAQVDAVTNNGPVYYMINCAHPTHFADILIPGEAWLERIHGVRANASTKSHAELNEAETLDDGNPAELGNQYRALKSKLKSLNVLGGCCGTDDRHVEAICQACLPLFWAHLSNPSLLATANSISL